MRKVLEYYKNFPKHEYRQLRSEISWAEYALWWVVRALMAFALYTYLKDPDRDFIYRLMILGNLAATFTVFLGRLIFTKFIFLGRLPYAMQRYITVTVFFGSFFGHYLGMYGKVQNYDKWLHLLIGFSGVFIGYHVMMAMKHNNKPVPPFMASFAGFGFSSFIAVIWEIFEFFTDYYIAGSCNQNYGWTVPEDMLFFKIFGLGVQNAGQTALFDTAIDMLLNVVGAVVGGIVIWPYVKGEAKRIMAGKTGPDALWWREAEETKPVPAPELEPEREPVTA